jgi:hypothetical protein
MARFLFWVALFFLKSFMMTKVKSAYTMTKIKSAHTGMDFHDRIRNWYILHSDKWKIPNGYLTFFFKKKKKKKEKEKKAKSNQQL